MKSVFYLLLCLALVLPFSGCLRRGCPGGQCSIQEVKQLTSTLQTNDEFIAVFYADWCGPCKTMKQRVLPNQTIQNIVKTKYKGNVYFINIDEAVNKPTLSDYNIKGIPVVAIYRVVENGKPVEIRRITGLHSVEEVIQFLSK